MWRAIIYLLFFLLLQAMDCSNLFLRHLQQFEEQIEDNYLGPMAKFWESFLNMVQILLDYIKSTRNANWDLHLSSMECMLPWFHAYDRVNYARHFTYCWTALNNLAETNPRCMLNSKRVTLLLNEHLDPSTCSLLIKLLSKQ